ncbi:hypothetical protein EJ02DRAFT_351691, partial [Clathrospora elynae]
MSAEPSTSSALVTVRLAADGRNRKDWTKQLSNYAASEGATAVLQNGTQPEFDFNQAQYRPVALIQVDHDTTWTKTQRDTEALRVLKINKLNRLINEDARALKKEDEKTLAKWVARDARLQNTILSSIDRSLTAQVRACSSVNAMYLVLKELNNSSDFANAQEAWAAFIDLRADQCRSVRNYIGKFREAVTDLVTQGLSFGWKKPSTDGATPEGGVDELMVIHFLYGLSKALPDWVEDRNNDLRQDKTWSIDTLILSVEHHILNVPEEPVKAFACVTKTAEEKRVLSQIQQQNNLSTPTPPALLTNCPKPRRT